MDNQIAALAKLLVPLVEREFGRKDLPKTGEIKKEDPATWPTELTEAWEDCCAKLQMKSKGYDCPVDTGGSADSGGL